MNKIKNFSQLKEVLTKKEKEEKMVNITFHCCNDEREFYKRETKRILSYFSTAFNEANVEKNYTKKDINNLRCFCIYFGLEFSLNKDKTAAYITDKKGDKWLLEKTFQYKPFLLNTLYYRYYTTKKRVTRRNGEKVVIENKEWTDIFVPKGTQLQYSNQLQKYYFVDEKFGNCYCDINVLSHNQSINIYALTMRNITSSKKTVNISHFINAILDYKSLNRRRKVLNGIELFYETSKQEYLFLKKISEVIRNIIY